MNNVIEHESVQALWPVEQTQMVSQADRLLELAITSNASPEYLDKLLDLKIKHDKEMGRRAFTAAMAGFKGEVITITKDKQVAFNDVSYMHATLGNIIKIATPFMAKHGLSHRWQTKQEGSQITVTCIVSHKDGHSEETSMTAQPDTSGKKNAIQQVASTITYLERYTFLAITGLAVEEQDDDAQAAEKPVSESITEDQANALHALITENDLNMGLFIGWLQKTMKINEIDQIPVDYYQRAVNKVNATIKAKKDAA
jgi:hypothetical protein